MPDWGALKRGFARFTGAALQQSRCADDDSPKRAYALVISIPVLAPNKHLIEDQLKLAKKQIADLSPDFLGAIGIDQRIKIDGAIEIKVEQKK